MAVEILLPQLGASIGSARLVRCLVGDGEQVVEGQKLFVIEHGSAAHDVEAPGTGTLKISAALDETYDAGAVLGYID